MSSAQYDVQEVIVAARLVGGVRAHARAPWEVYGHWHADPAQSRTDVYYLLHPTGAEVRP